MASIVAGVPPPTWLGTGRTSLFKPFQKLPFSETSIVAGVPPPTWLGTGRTSLFTPFQKLPFSPLREKQNRVAIVVKAAGESSDSSTSLSIVKSVQNVWDEDRLAFIGLGFAAIVALWASANLVSAIDKLPLIPSAFELIGIIYSAWFVYRYLLFKPDREELFQIINKSISAILEQ